MTSKSLTAAATAAIAIGSMILPLATASAAELTLLCASGMRAVLSELKPQIERVTGNSISISYGEAGDLRKRMQNGEAADVVVLPRVVLDQVLTQDKTAVMGTAINLAQSAMGIGVRADEPKPDISSPERLKRALLAAKAISITDPASGGVSGVHIADVFRRLGIAEEIKPKLKLNRGASNAELVAKGDADIAIQLAHEILAVPGIAFIPLPQEFERTFVFSAALGAKARQLVASNELLRLLSGPAAVAVIRAKGMEPTASR